MNCRRHWMWLLLLFGTLPPGCAAETPTGVQVETTPQSLELTSCDEAARLLVIARNSSNNEIASDLEIKTFADIPIKVAPESASAKTLKPGEAGSWEFKVNCVSGFSTGALQVVLTSKLSRAGGPLAQITTKSVTVKLRDPELLDSIAAIDVKSTLESLTTGEADELNVAVTNKTARRIEVSIAASGPSFIKFENVGKNPLTIEPLRAEIIPFTATATSRVKPGKQLLIFRGQLKTDHGSRDFVLTREVTVGVLGESEALKLLGAPSLLFLPGFLVVSAYLFLWRLKWLRHDSSTTPPVEEKSSGFWLLAITISIIISGAFQRQRPDFFSYYGLGDLITVWLVSIGLGCLAYLVRHWYVNWREARKYPSEKDTPVEVLRKLQPIISDMAVGRVDIKKGKTPAFLLIPNADGSAYVCPQMVLSWEPNADVNLRELIRKQLTAGGKLQTVLSVVEEELKKREEKQPSSVKGLAWDTSDPENLYAHKLFKDDLLGHVDADIIVRQAP